MKIAWATDIHLDFCARPVREAFHAELRDTGAEAVLLTGDLATAATLDSLLLELAAAVERPVYFVLGNHDFYGSSVAAVRARAHALSARDERLRWLPAAGLVPLGATAALIGHDGWADGRFGDWERSTVVINDYVQIEDLASARLVRAELLPRIQGLAAEAAVYFREALPGALEGRRQVLVATHVPPFREACWHEGRISDDAWLPHFSSKVAGEALIEAARDRPEVAVTVLCGHTHGEGTARILPNLTVLTGGAVYGKPRLQQILDVE